MGTGAPALCHCKSLLAIYIYRYDIIKMGVMLWDSPKSLWLNHRVWGQICYAKVGRQAVFKVFRNII